MYPWQENFISCCFVCIMVFHFRSSGAAHTHRSYPPHSFCSSCPFLCSINSLTPTQNDPGHGTWHIYTTHSFLQIQYVGPLCSHIKQKIFLVRALSTKSSPQYPAPKKKKTRDPWFISMSMCLPWAELQKQSTQAERGNSACRCGIWDELITYYMQC